MIEQVSEQTLTETISFEDFLKRFDGYHAEWVGGRVEIYVSNNTFHQLLLAFLTELLRLYLGLKGSGKLLIAGVPMWLGEDQPAREPDLMIILNKHLDRIKETYIDGTADIVIELVSPESDERDHGRKFIEYEAAGIPEYWLFDPLRKEAAIYVLGEDQRYHRHDLDAQGKLISSILPDFALDASVLWRDELPVGQELLDLLRGMGVLEK